MNYDNTIELIAGVEVRFTPTDEGNISMEIVESSNGESVVYSAEQDLGFYRSDQKVGTIANRIESGVPAGIDGEAVANEFRSLCSTLSANHDDVQATWLPPIVTDLLEQTQCVEVYGGDPTTFAVTMKRDGAEHEIEFTTGEFMAPNSAPFRDKYGAVFYEKIDIEPDVWERLVDEWLEMKEIVAVESYSEEQATADEVADVLADRLTPVDDRNVLANGTMSAWYDEDNSKHDKDVANATDQEDPDVLWVRSDAVREVLPDVGKPREYFGTLSGTLRKTGMTFTTTKGIVVDGDEKRCCTFDPEVLGIPCEAVHSSDEDVTGVDP